MQEQQTEPTTDAMAHAAQTLAVTFSVIEAIARLRAQRANDRAGAAERAWSAARATEALQHTSARLTWTPALEDPMLRRLSATELLHAWSPAIEYRHADPTAAQAADHIEERLRVLHPEAMAVYQDQLGRGQSADVAMAQACRFLRGEFGLDPAGTPLRFDAAVNAKSRGNAATSPDDPATPHTDEATQGQHMAAAGKGAADAFRARALADLSLPVPIDEAMATAPRAARTMLALPPAVTRRAITAVPPGPRSSRRHALSP
jgi:hypothetical protein